MKSSLKVAFVAMLSFFAANTVAYAQDMPAKDLVQIATDEGNFTVWNRALEQAGLTQTFKGAGPYTVFAPTDDAFAKLPAGKLDSLMADPQALRDLLLSHVVEGDVASADVAAMSSANTMGGSAVAISSSGTGVRVNESNVIEADLQASNGRIHAIDAVLIPPMRE